MFHPFLTVQAGAPRHCLSIALALLAITSNITNYYYTRPPFRCAARACADAVLPAALHCSLLCISELCLRPNPCGIECTDCTAQYTLPEMGGSIEPPEPPLATGLPSYQLLFQLQLTFSCCYILENRLCECIHFSVRHASASCRKRSGYESRKCFFS